MLALLSPLNQLTMDGICFHIFKGELITFPTLFTFSMSFLKTYHLHRSYTFSICLPSSHTPPTFIQRVLLLLVLYFMYFSLPPLTDRQQSGQRYNHNMICEDIAINKISTEIHSHRDRIWDRNFKVKKIQVGT